MKKIRVQISDDSEVVASISEMDRQIPASTRSSPEFPILYEQVITCIEDFASRARKLARSGTTIHIEKELSFADISILIALDYPKKTGLLDRIKGIFKRG